MKIKHTEGLIKLALESNKTIQEFEELALSKLFKYNVINQCEKSDTILDFPKLNIHATRALILNVIEEIGLESSNENLDTFEDLIIIMDGDCPECGGDLKEDTEKARGYYNKGRWIQTYSYKICSHCGEVVEEYL